MQDFTTWFRSVLSVISGVLISFLGGADKLLTAFFIILFLDMFTGIFKAHYFGEYESSLFRQGLYRKIAYFIAIMLVVQIDFITSQPGTFRSILLTFISYNETISIIENLGAMGVPFPQCIIDAIKALKNNTNSKK